MDSNKKHAKEQPFFAQFLEDQDVAEAQGGAGGGTATLKYPSDRDEMNQTLKYPSDGDEGGYDLP